MMTSEMDKQEYVHRPYLYPKYYGNITQDRVQERCFPFQTKIIALPGRDRLSERYLNFWYDTGRRNPNAYCVGKYQTQMSFRGRRYFPVKA